MKSRQISLNQSEDALGYMSENCAYEFRAIFDNGNLLVDDLSTIVQESIKNVDSCTEQNISSCREMAFGLTSNSKYPVSLYITFNPEYFREDIWMVQGLDGTVEDLSVNGEAMDEWLSEWRSGNSYMSQFFWEVVDEDAKWFEAAYEPEVKWNVVSRARAVYDEKGKLIGIIGADIYLGDIEERLNDINKKTGGLSAVINNEGDLIAGSEKCLKLMDDDSYISASAEMGDLWTVIIVQPHDKAIGRTTEMIFVTIVLGAVLLVGLLSVMIFVYRKHGKPIISKFEEKDLLMLNQARQAQMGEMVGNIAHQLKQPLNGVNMAMSNLNEDYGRQVDDEEEFRKRIDRIRARIRNMSETIDDFMMFLKPQKEQSSFSVIENINSVVSMMEERIKLYSINVEISGDDFYLNGYSNEFSQCIFNIIDNAVYEIKKQKLPGEIRITVSSGTIRIENTGDRIDEQLMDSLFDLYFTTKGNEGTGIGLYLTKSIIEMHYAGTVTAANTDEGVCFEICIPAEE